MGCQEVLKAQHISEINQPGRHKITGHDPQKGNNLERHSEGQGLVRETSSSGAPWRLWVGGAPGGL